MTSFSGGPFQRQQLRITDLSSEQLGALSSNPPVFVPAPGAGLALVIQGVYNLVSPGSVPFAGLSLNMVYEGDTTDLLTTDMTLSGTSVLEYHDFLDQVSSSLFEDTALVGSTMSDSPAQGAILTSSLNVGGADYAPGDTFTVDGGTDGAGVVDTVDGGGAVLTYHLTDNGLNYVVATGVATTATSGIGTGLTLDILTITPATGTARVYVYYSVLELP